MCVWWHSVTVYVCDTAGAAVGLWGYCVATGRANPCVRQRRVAPTVETGSDYRVLQTSFSHPMRRGITVLVGHP